MPPLRQRGLAGIAVNANPIRQLLLIAAAGREPTGADLQALPLNPDSAAEVRDTVARTAGTVKQLRNHGLYAPATRLAVVAAADLKRHLDSREV